MMAPVMGASSMTALEKMAPMAATMTPEGRMMAKGGNGEEELGERFGRFMNSFMNSVEQKEERRDSGKAPRRDEDPRDERTRSREAPQRGYYAPPLYDPWGTTRWGSPYGPEDPWMGGSDWGYGGSGYGGYGGPGYGGYGGSGYGGPYEESWGSPEEYGWGTPYRSYGGYDPDEWSPWERPPYGGPGPYPPPSRGGYDPGWGW